MTASCHATHLGRVNGLEVLRRTVRGRRGIHRSLRLGLWTNESAVRHNARRRLGDSQQGPRPAGQPGGNLLRHEEAVEAGGSSRHSVDDRKRIARWLHQHQLLDEVLLVKGIVHRQIGLVDTLRQRLNEMHDRPAVIRLTSEEEPQCLREADVRLDIFYGADGPTHVIERQS